MSGLGRAGWRATLVLGVAMSGTLYPAIVRAQTAQSSADAQPRPAAPAAATVPGEGEIIVTAFKRAESSLRVSATINVVQGSQLKTVGVNTITDIQNLVPGLNIGASNFGTNISIRGVTSTDETSKGELGIAFNIDGAFVGRGQEQGVAFFDLDRVEVLKGPQGTLYGRSSTGGAINIITKKPVIGDWSGYARIEYGNYESKRAEAALNIPINDMLALRVSGSFNDRDGYLRPVDTIVTGSPTAFNGTGPSTFDLSGIGQPKKGDQKDRTGRFSLLFKPSSDVTATIIATVGHIGGVGPGSALLDNLDHGDSRQFDVVPDTVPAYINDNFYNFNEQLNVKFGAVQVDLLGNEEHFSDHSQLTSNFNPFNTGNATAGPSYQLDNYQGVFDTNQVELRLSNVNSGFLDYVAGANYYHEQTRESDHNWLAPLAIDGSLTPTSDWTNAIDPLNRTTHESYGVFGQATAHVTSKIGIVGGVRYTHDQSTRVGTFALGAVPGCSYPADCIGGPNNGNETDSKVTWRAGINYQADPRDLFYASVSTGFKAGGFNDFDPSSGTTAPYGPESLTAYEIGYKGKPVAKLTFTTAFYYYDYSADQINGLTLFPTAGGVVGVLFTQVKPVEIYGWENELHYDFDRHTQFGAALALESSRIIHLETGFLGYLTGAFVNFRDKAVSNAPGVVANVSGTHSVDLGNGGELRLRAFSKFSSGYYLNDYADAVRYRQNSFTRTDLSLTYAAPQDRYTVQLFVENVENGLQKTAGPNNYNGGYGGFTGGNATPAVDGTAFPRNSVNLGVSNPRFFGMRLGTKF